MRSLPSVLTKARRCVAGQSRGSLHYNLRHLWAILQSCDPVRLPTYRPISQTAVIPTVLEVREAWKYNQTKVASLRLAFLRWCTDTNRHPFVTPSMLREALAVQHKIAEPSAIELQRARVKVSTHPLFLSCSQLCLCVTYSTALLRKAALPYLLSRCVACEQVMQPKNHA